MIVSCGLVSVGKDRAFSSTTDARPREERAALSLRPRSARTIMGFLQILSCLRTRRVATRDCAPLVNDSDGK
jgi:hypothetical protein